MRCCTSIRSFVSGDTYLMIFLSFLILASKGRGDRLRGLYLIKEQKDF